MSGLTIAVPRGALFEETLDLLDALGIDTSAVRTSPRRLLFSGPGLGGGVERIVTMRPSDVPTYVEWGAADLGVTGKDVLLESPDREVYELLDLRYGLCRMVVAARAGDHALEESLRRLGTDFVDLWLIHWTEGGSAHEDLWGVLLEAQKARKVRDVGVSNYSPDQIDQLVEETGQQPAVNQIKWAPTLFDADVARWHEQRGIVLEGYSALKNTDLDDPVLREVADAHGVTTAQVLLRWHLDHGFVAIPKSATPERIAANFAVTGFSLEEEELHRIDGMARS